MKAIMEDKGLTEAGQILARDTREFLKPFLTEKSREGYSRADIIYTLLSQAEGIIIREESAKFMKKRMGGTHV